MWKKHESKPVTASSPQVSAPSRATPSQRQGSCTQRTATIGPSISICGDICGEGDLLIEGKVEGGIRLHQHDVTVGRSGRVEADVHGKRICVEGQVKGDLFGEEVVIRKSGRVEGNATAPRVVLEDGCNFRGEINMKPEVSRPEISKGAKHARQRRAVPQAVHA